MWSRLLVGRISARLQNDARFEAALSWKHRAAQPRFRDLAWDGDTVYHQSTVRERWRREAFGGWAAQLKKVGATVVIAQFGKIESLDGIGRVGEFAAAYGELLDVFSADGRRVVLLAPSPTGWNGGDAESFARYTAAVRALAGQRGIRFVPASDDDPTSALRRGLGLGEAPVAVVEAVREKHRLWYDYWRPANWKCLFGDDGKRIFSNAAEGLPSFKEEWSTFPELIAAAEAKLYAGEPVVARPAPARTGSVEADIEDELAAFEVLDGYEVNLFADESHGIANPLSLRWDPDGRMFVACSDVYPQIEPGVMPDDKIIVLRDADADGRADQSSVFARGLNIPTGMEVGADGVYVGQNTELLFLDWVGGRRQLLSGFGNGDSHQTINSFVWVRRGRFVVLPGGWDRVAGGDPVRHLIALPGRCVSPAPARAATRRAAGRFHGAGEPLGRGLRRFRPVLRSRRGRGDLLLDAGIDPGEAPAKAATDRQTRRLLWCGICRGRRIFDRGLQEEPGQPLSGQRGWRRV